MRKFIMLVFIGILLTMSPVYADVESPLHEGHQSSKSTIPHELERNGHEDSAPQRGGHDHGGEAVESPPNYPVLAAFAFINAAFLLVGVILKYRVGKEQVTI